MKQRLKPDVDIVLNVLEEVLTVKPNAGFVQSLLQQYQERGGLSKKQLEGLLAIAQKTGALAANKLTTLEAIIKKKPTRYKSIAPPPTPLYVKDESVGTMLQTILEKYPQHKRVLFLKAKYDNNETLSGAEMDELKKFNKLLK